MKKSVLSAVLAVTFVSFGFSQRLVQISNSGNSGGASMAVLLPSTPINVENIAGSPYIPTNFVPGKVSTMPNQVYMVRYNAVNDEMVIKDNEKALALNKNIPGVFVTVMSSKKRYQTFNIADSKKKTGFFIVESSPNANIKLLNKEYVEFINKQVAANSYQSDRPAKFKRADDTFYLSMEENTAILMPRKKKELIKLFPGKDVAKFIKKERISLKDKQDLIKLVNFLNS